LDGLVQLQFMHCGCTANTVHDFACKGQLTIRSLVARTTKYTVKPVLNGISRVENIFPLKPGFRLIKVYYDSHRTWKYFHLR
jgi:hypothetical protein